MIEGAPETFHIQPWQQALQTPAKKGADIVLPRQELDQESQENLAQAAKLLREMLGMLVVMDHWAKPEFTWLFRTLFDEPEFSERGGLMVLGAHEYHKRITIPAAAVGVKTMPMVVYSGRKVMGLKNRSFLSGATQFSKAAGERLAQGGVVIATPQGHREPKLGEPKYTFIHDLIDSARQAGARDTAILPIGIGLTGRKSLIRSFPEDVWRRLRSSDQTKSPYENQGFHFFEEGVVKIRPPRLASEVLAIAGGDPHEVEWWAFDELKEAVPADYL